MHEYGVVRKIIKIVSSNALKAKAKKVEEISLVVGELSGYIGDTMQMYFNLCAQNTICEGATLIIDYVPAKWHCPNCNRLYTRNSTLSYSCPTCGADGNTTDFGKEFYIKSTRIIT
jgi:hydrogenase nickel incorporation protein HypA/HybF